MAWLDDDGEPSGTGGRPALGAIEAAGLVEAAAVVTRWYGGTKLGTGGLARAYATAVARALASLPTARVVRAATCRVRFEHPDTGTVMRLLEAAGARRGKLCYGTGVELDALVPLDVVAELARSLVDATSGRADLEVGEGRDLLPLVPPSGSAT